MFFAHGSFQWTTAAATTTIPVTGLGFTPKLIKFMAMGISSATDLATETASDRRTLGFCTSTSNRRSIGQLSVDAAATMDCQQMWHDAAVLCIPTATPGVDGLLDVNSFDTDGFTAIIDDALAADITVFWAAWGGSELTNVEAFDIGEPATAVATNYVLAGAFQPDMLMFGGIQILAATNTPTADDTGFMIGAASGTPSGNQWVLCTNQDNGSTSADTDKYMRGGECIAQILNGGGNPNARASLSAFNSDGFQLTWAVRGVTGRKYIGAAIKGGNWSVGTYTIDATTLNATTTISGLPFSPLGLIDVTHYTVQEASGVSTTTGIMGIGWGSSPVSRRAMGITDEDATASSAAEVNEVVEYDQLCAAASTTGTLAAARDIDVMTPDGFRIIVDNNGGAPSATEFHGYITFGNVVPKYSVIADLPQPDRQPRIPVPYR